MTEEFYHKDIFGTVVNIDLGEQDEDEAPLIDKKGREFNIFALTDALGARDKKRAWILYQEALLAGLSAEEVFFKVVCQIKSMLIASKTKSVAETDMKAFPYSKAKSFLKNFSISELQNLSTELVIGYHRARQGEGEIETLVEKVILSL
ncbi:MAG: hypothetical protein Q8P21_01215 [bacterium]|nr:hypothetical protein [bacterium]